MTVLPVVALDAEDDTQDTQLPNVASSSSVQLTRSRPTFSKPLLCFFPVNAFDNLALYSGLNYSVTKNRSITNFISSEKETNSFRIGSDIFLLLLASIACKSCNISNIFCFSSLAKNMWLNDQLARLFFGGFVLCEILFM